MLLQHACQAASGEVKNVFFLEFDAEVKRIQQMLYDEHKARVQTHDTYNMKGKLVNFLMRQFEAQLLLISRVRVGSLHVYAQCTAVHVLVYE